MTKVDSLSFVHDIQGNKPIKYALLTIKHVHEDVRNYENCNGK